MTWNDSAYPSILKIIHSIVYFINDNRSYRSAVPDLKALLIIGSMVDVKSEFLSNVARRIC